MNDDVEIPAVVPHKRRQLEAALPQWLAVWANDENQPPSARRRAQEERDRRKAADPTMPVGFTGTRAGMTPQQRAAVTALLAELRATEVHHGDCVGADAQFHGVCWARKVPIVLHPPTGRGLRAWSKGATVELPPAPYLDRNKDIVKASRVLIAAPKEPSEPEPGPGQGTWSTVRYARNRGIAVKLVFPDGTVSA